LVKGKICRETLGFTVEKPPNSGVFPPDFPLIQSWDLGPQTRGRTHKTRGNGGFRLQSNLAYETLMKHRLK